MDEVMTVPPPTSIFTCAVVAPRFTSRIFPLMMFRALRRMSRLPCRDDGLLTPASCRHGEPCPRREADRLEVAGDPAVRRSQVHVQVRFSRGEDAPMPR